MRKPFLKRTSAKFEKLEDRCLLSISLPTGTNLVENHDFESVESGLVTDWTGSTDPASFNFAARPERASVAWLAGGQSMSQDIPVAPGQNHAFSFEYRLGPGSNAANLTVGGSASGLGTMTPTKRWQTATLLITPDDLGGTPQNPVFNITFQSDNDVFIDCPQLVPVQAVSLTNASFEDAPSPVNQYFKSNDFAGWNSVGDRRVKNLNIKREGGSDGNRFLNLDGSNSALDRVYQDFATENGQNYYVSFDIKSPTGSSGVDDQVRVRWNGNFGGSFFGGTDWSSVGFFTSSNSDSTRLLFREVGGIDGGDGRGPHIDNLQVFQIQPGRDSFTINHSGTSNKSFTENGGPLGLFQQDLELANSVRDELTGAVVQIQNLVDGTSESLTVDAGETGIRANYDPDTGRLRLSGRGSTADYETVFNTLAYNNTSENPNPVTRKIRFSIDHGSSFSSSEFLTVEINPVNDSPQISSIEDASLTVLTSFNFQTVASDPEGSPLTYTIASAGTALGNGDTPPTISSSGVINWTPQQSGMLDVTVTVEDPEGQTAHRSFTLSALLDAPLPGNFAPFSGSRQLSNVVPILRNNVYSSAPPMNIDTANEYRATFQTDDGLIEILLYDNDTPETVNSFVNLARDGFYDGLTFHRVISLTGSPTSGFIAQGGDPLGTGTGGPGYNYGDENLLNANFDKPVIAMANRGAGTNSNGSQFFLTYDDQVQHLNGGHTIFGEITSGLGVVNQITKRDPNSGIPAEIIRKVTITETEP